MKPTFSPNYSDSKALIIGINEYIKASPLQYAVSDAESIAEILVDKFAFLSENVKVLLDKDATQINILKEYLSLANPTEDTDGRLIVYFAGHGHTIKSRRGDVGFLVPYDGVVDELSSLIRWDQLTRNADLMPAKHILFLMDACYGGLAITRSLSPGTTRFLRDMLLRVSRQVITAGKANEVVSDSGGPLPGHSVFTGHLLEALSGSAADSDGVLTANGVMSYVYHRVARDPDSYQTPHFGYLDGDGDMIFSAPVLDDISDEKEEEGHDILFAVPVPISDIKDSIEMTDIAKTKEYLSDPKYRIRLHDFVTEKTRDCMALTSDDLLPVSGSFAKDDLLIRLEKYEKATNELISISSLLGYWADDEHLVSLSLPIKRLSERNQRTSGSTMLLALRWYPILLLTYSIGIASVASSKLKNLLSVLHTPIVYSSRFGDTVPFILCVQDETSVLHDIFRTIPGHERQFVPRSEYLHKHLQPILDDLLFLGAEYENLFDRFEILFALEHVHQYKKYKNDVWGPVGRFGWKHHHDTSPYMRMLKEAELGGDNWEPIKSGFFDGSFQRFQEISAEFSHRLENLGWH